MPKASAVAHPIQGLVKYHGLRDPVRRIPFHDSISVCTGPIKTHTTVEVLGDGDSSATIDGEPVTGRAWDRVCAVVRAIQEHAEDDRPFRMASQSDFPKYVGLGSSSSGFAALAVAAADAYRVEMDLEQLSEFARLGAGSACRAVTGGVSEWRVDGQRSYSHRMMDHDDLDWAIIVPLVAHEEPTEGIHQEVTTSPLFQARVDYMADALGAARKACRDGDLEALWATAEKDTLNLHAVTMTGQAGHFTWQPATMAVMRAVRALRETAVPAYFSIDTGATAYINTPTGHADAVADAVKDIADVSDVLRLAPAGPARIVDEHLF